MAILKNKLVLIIVAVLFLGGGGTYYFLVMDKAPETSAKKKNQDKGEHGEDVQDEDGEHGSGEAHASEEDSHEEEASEEGETKEDEEEHGGGHGGGHGETKGPIMEPFVVNLADPGSRRYLRLNLKLELKKREESEPLLEARMPQVRDAVLMLLSSKTTDQLVSTEGKTALREELISQINKVLKKKKTKKAVKNLYFTEFLIQ